MDWLLKQMNAKITRLKAERYRLSCSPILSKEESTKLRIICDQIQSATEWLSEHDVLFIGTPNVGSNKPTANTSNDKHALTGRSHEKLTPSELAFALR